MPHLITIIIYGVISGACIGMALTNPCFAKSPTFPVARALVFALSVEGSLLLVFWLKL